MPEHISIQRVRIYLSERDSFEGQPLYIAVLERMRREGATGATATRGVAGFGPGQRVRTAGTIDLTQAQPLVIEWVDRAERIAKVLPALDALIPTALITLEDVRVYRAVLRASGPFGERTVGDALVPAAAVASPQISARAAVEQLLAQRLDMLPVLDSDQRLLGVLSGADLYRRGLIRLPSSLLAGFAPAECAPLLAALESLSVAECMTSEPRTIYVEASIPQAIGMLIEWDLDSLPVIDGDGRLAGIIGVEQALRAAIATRPPADAAVRDAEPPAPVHLVMQTSVPTLPAHTPLSEALRLLLRSPARLLVVIAEGRPVGIMRSTQIAAALDASLRAAWLELLGTPTGAVPLALEFSTTLLAGDVMNAVPRIAMDTSERDAIQQMLDGGHDYLLVTDSSGRLAGLLARRVLLRALSQESAG